LAIVVSLLLFVGRADARSAKKLARLRVTRNAVRSGKDERKNDLKDGRRD
jgi:hypothetical protein